MPLDPAPASASACPATASTCPATASACPSSGSVSSARVSARPAATSARPASSPAPPVRFWPVDDLPALDPDPFLDEVLREEPVSRIRLPYGAGWAWLVTRYDDVRFVTSDPRFSRERVVGRDVPAMRPAPVASQTAGLQYIDPP
ncbi:hypothetical protein ACWCQG_23035, partial [Streptomyces sp. NPDC002343]